jgi:hypothetical protein
MIHIKPSFVYKFNISVTDLTVTNISEGKFQNYGNITYDRLDVLDPWGVSGYQIQTKDTSPVIARTKIVKMLKDMGFKLALNIRC